MSIENKKLPVGWKIVIAADIMDIRDGTHNTPKYVQENGIPLITSKNLKGNDIDFNKVNYISTNDHLEISKRSKVENGDILFAMIGTIGNPAIINHDTNFSIKNVGLFKKNTNFILPIFFVNFLRSSLFEKQLNVRKLLKGTTQRFIPLGNLRKIEIPLPPLPIQHLIVSKIEELFSELDKGIENLKLAQQQLKTYRQSVLKWAFEGKLTNENVIEGELPEGWKWTSMSKVCTKIGDIDHKMPKQLNEGFPYVSTKDFTNNLKISFDNAKYISEEDYLNLSRKIKPEKGDIIFPRYGTIGKNILIDFDKEFLVSYSCAVVKPDQNIVLSNYLYLYSLSPQITDEIRKYVVETTQANIGIASIKSFVFPLASKEEQQLVVQEIESRLSVADKMEESITQSLLQAEALRQSILKKAFEGKLV